MSNEQPQSLQSVNSLWDHPNFLNISNTDAQTLLITYNGWTVGYIFAFFHNTDEPNQTKKFKLSAINAYNRNMISIDCRLESGSILIENLNDKNTNKPIRNNNLSTIVDNIDPKALQLQLNLKDAVHPIHFLSKNDLKDHILNQFYPRDVLYSPYFFYHTDANNAEEQLKKFSANTNTNMIVYCPSYTQPGKLHMMTKTKTFIEHRLLNYSQTQQQSSQLSCLYESEANEFVEFNAVISAQLQRNNNVLTHEFYKFEPKPTHYSLRTDFLIGNTTENPAAQKSNRALVNSLPATYPTKQQSQSVTTNLLCISVPKHHSNEIPSGHSTFNFWRNDTLGQSNNTQQNHTPAPPLAKGPNNGGS